MLFHMFVSVQLYVCNQLFLESVHFLKFSTAIKAHFLEKPCLTKIVFFTFRGILSLLFAANNLKWKMFFLCKPHIWKNSVVQVGDQNALVQSDWRIFLTSISVEIMHQFLWLFAWRYSRKKSSINTNTFDCVWPGMPSHAQTCADVIGILLRYFWSFAGKNNSEQKIVNF